MENKQDIILISLTKALKKLKDVLEEPENTIIRDASIQRFEFTFELSWKFIYEILKNNGIRDVYGSKNIFREALRLGLIDNIDTWFEYLKQRNLTSHAYNELVAISIYNSLPNFVDDVEKVIEKAKNF
jgi:nucleotidyltransferase substrate binding protein (TIGR01987 family)